MEATNTTVVKNTIFLVPMATVVPIMENSASSVRECSKMVNSRKNQIVKCNDSKEAKLINLFEF